MVLILSFRRVLIVMIVMGVEGEMSEGMGTDFSDGGCERRMEQ